MLLAIDQIVIYDYIAKQHHFPLAVYLFSQLRFQVYGALCNLSLQSLAIGHGHM